MENLDLSQFGDIYRGRRVLLTGHTGFKGSWLALWLQRLGSDITAVALPPETTPNHWDLLDLNISEHRTDQRDASAIAQIMRTAQPQIIFHLAAQALVRRSYHAPLDTWSTNVMGTANLLEAARQTPSVQAIVVVTSDKCYQNREWLWGYRENDTLGGHDHYSASKAATELVAASYRQTHCRQPETPAIATARAGNVIGGGDWAEDRLVPDLARAMANRKALHIRSPRATRPWQHVLESLSGYLLLGAHLLQHGHAFAEAWNFGPETEGNQTVEEMLHAMRKHWPDLRWSVDTSPQPHEATLLWLDSAKSRHRLSWQPVWNFERGLQATAEWYRVFLETGTVPTQQQLDAYISDAAAAGLTWCQP